MLRAAALGVASASLATVAYTYAGYPLLVAALSRLAPGRVREDPTWRPRVSALIPVYNAAKYVEPKVRSLLALDWPADRLEILLYVDGATDDTEAVCQRLAAEDPRVRVLVSRERSGKPTGVNRMKALATGEVLLMTDVRQPLVPGSLRALVSRLADPEVGCVSGNLVLEGSTGAGAYWRYESWIRDSEARFRSMVGVTGPIYVVRKADLDELPDDVILDDMWVPLKLRLEGKKLLFAEEAVALDAAFDDDRELGRKIRTLAGNYQLYARMPALLTPKNPSFFEVMSHKVARLVCPFALVGLFGGTLVLALPGGGLLARAVRGPARALLTAQLGAYALAALGPRAGKLGALPRTFVVLNYAAVAGLLRHLQGTQKITW
jgi:biofilm PGA synthesis N-glycosyltransferase PgaC